MLEALIAFLVICLVGVFLVVRQEHHPKKAH
jgi:hypothetical protein